MIRIFTVIGARPQFIKAAPITRSIAAFNRKEGNVLEQTIIHTGQHYDENMSDVFFKELDIPLPAYFLEAGSGTHAVQTGKIMTELEPILADQKPDYILVYGDTNSTVAAALVAAKLNIPIAHVEAGLRSHNRRMPEELNRIVTDRLSTLLFCPNEEGVNNLAQEGITQGVYNTGDVMVDQLSYTAGRSYVKCLEKEYIFLTLHRQETCDSYENLKEILDTINKLSYDIPIMLPVHPRMKRILEGIDIEFSPYFHRIEPLSYKDTINYVKYAKMVLTDSGGLQKEAYILKTPCITLRTETEWNETLTFGWNRLVGLSSETLNRTIAEALTFDRSTDHPSLYGDGKAAERILKLIAESVGVK